MNLLLTLVVVYDCMFTATGLEVMAYNFTANGYQYGLSTRAMSMTDAKTACADLNGELASFNTNAEYFTALKILTTYLTSRGTKEVWVSFKVVSIAEKLFSWNSELFNASVWASGEPNDNCDGTTSECCARIEIAAGLRDRGCKNEYNFLCVFKTCPGGFQLDKGTCVDVDECSASQRVCQQNCTNTNGSFTCQCGAGYVLAPDGRNCSYQNNSKSGCLCDVTASGTCSCRCPAGFTGTSGQCVDVDECSTSTNNCSQICQNTNGSYSCSCYHGYRVSSSDRARCEDVNECTDNSGLCDHTCTNTNGSYFCTCSTGFYLDTNKKTCLDINECTSGLDVCDYNCTNTNGSYYCTCPPGYHLNTITNRKCHDINECDFVPNVCEFTCLNQTNCPNVCTNTMGSFNCSCPPGYATVDTRCVDIDECAVGHDCSHMCQNTNGSYTCYCRPGFHISLTDNTQCDDINECLDDHHDCDHNCTNTNGSYYCTCRTGYHLDTTDNKTCHDINECDNTTLCQHRCHNTPGSYFCACPDGFQTGPDGHSCVQKFSFNMCPCRCGTRTLTFNYIQIEKAVDGIKKDLTVETRDLSSFTRLKTCAEDTRQTAETVGYCGIVFMTAVACLIILPDMFTVGCVLLQKFREFPY